MSIKFGLSDFPNLERKIELEVSEIQLTLKLREKAISIDVLKDYSLPNEIREKDEYELPNEYLSQMTIQSLLTQLEIHFGIKFKV